MSPYVPHLYLNTSSVVKKRNFNIIQPNYITFMSFKCLNNMNFNLQDMLVLWHIKKLSYKKLEKLQTNTHLSYLNGIKGIITLKLNRRKKMEERHGK